MSMTSRLMTLLFKCLAFFDLPCTEYAIQTSCMDRIPNACLIISRLPVATFPRFAQNLMHTRCRIHAKSSSGQIHDSAKIRTSTQMHEILYTDSIDMLLSSTFALRYYNCCVCVCVYIYIYIYIISLAVPVPEIMDASCTHIVAAHLL
jgi:hypothetical protein